VGRRVGRAGTPFAQLLEVAAACRVRYADIVLVLGLEGLRWGELAGLQVGDLVTTPGPGLRITRAVLSSKGGGELYVMAYVDRELSAGS
jgi:integrase